MEDIRINRITVNINQKDNETIISLYRTNQLLGQINTDKLDIDSFSESGVSVKAYQAYCKDVVINLIDNGGISGYFYEPKAENAGQKYDIGTFKSKCKEYIQLVIGDSYEFKMNGNDNIIEIEQYIDKYIKNAKAIFGVTLNQYDIKFVIQAEIKSGQMCRPKTIIFMGNEYSFNITNINKIVKSNS